ncbi:hypothetical protein TSAR_008979 [Trichomalopsis sarcophagae]|uniref:Uncharacterized protein n=1 Tax=Trichomalopsis sarcophagae TaxID=543379 RepID=A0A232FCJ0_9HYME|nr:hypothetical protein TSAR_008979 [Trichomalopsis sarcophagae]
MEPRCLQVLRRRHGILSIFSPANAHYNKSANSSLQEKTHYKFWEKPLRSLGFSEGACEWATSYLTDIGLGWLLFLERSVIYGVLLNTRSTIYTRK